MDVWKDWQIKLASTYTALGSESGYDCLTHSWVRDLWDTHKADAWDRCVYPRPHLSVSTRMRLRNIKLANLQKTQKLHRHQSLLFALT